MSEDGAGGFSIQTYKETFLSSPLTGDGKELRADAITAYESTLFRILIQTRFKPKLNLARESKEQDKVSKKELEEVVGRKLEPEEVGRLKKARKEGNFHTAILDARVKGKHDKFA